MFFEATSKSDEESNDSLKVTIHIWLPRINGKNVTAQEAVSAHIKKNFDSRRGDRVGHVSIETRSVYASWWPNQNNENEEEVGIFNCVKAQNSNYKIDCNSEGENPNLSISLFSLDIQAIEDCFENIKKTQYGYVLAGDKTITRLYNSAKGQSCSGLAYEILIAGGLSKLTKIHKDLKAKWVIVTPDNLANMLQNAKEVESKLLLKTSHDRDTTADQQSIFQKCNIM